VVQACARYCIRGATRAKSAVHDATKAGQGVSGLREAATSKEASRSMTVM